MILHDVRVHPSKDNLKREDQLAWKIAAVAADKVAGGQGRDGDDRQSHHRQRRRGDRVGQPPSGGVRARHGAGPSARKDAARRCSALPSGKRVSPEYAAWANGTAVRELDMHDTFLAADYSHPGDNIPPVLAVAQTMGKSGRDLMRGIATGYEIHINLVRAISLHKHKIDHITHLCRRPGRRHRHAAAT